MLIDRLLNYRKAQADQAYRLFQLQKRCKLSDKIQTLIRYQIIINHQLMINIERCINQRQVFLYLILQHKAGQYMIELKESLSSAKRRTIKGKSLHLLR